MELLACRAMESRCRRRAAPYPSESGRWLLVEAAMWQRKPIDSISDHFEDCNTNPVAILQKGASYKYTGLQIRTDFAAFTDADDGKRCCCIEALRL